MEVITANKIDAVLIDIDATIARKTRPRSSFDHSDILLTDEPIEEMVEILEAYIFNTNTYPVFLTGRKTIGEEYTRQWIATHTGFKEYKLFMRGANDWRPAYAVKKQIVCNEILPYYNIKLVFDDEPKNAEMFKNLGLITLQVFA
jgi:hypothetical protein